MNTIIKTTDKWFPILTRRRAVLLGWLESAGYGEKLLGFTNLDLTDYKEIRVVKDKEYTIFLEGVTWAKTEEKFRKRLETDRSYLDRIFVKFYPKLSALEELSKPKNLSELSNLELNEMILTYAELYTDISPFYIVYSEVRPILKEETENWLKTKVPASKLQDYHIILTTPLKSLYAVEENKSLQKVAEAVKRNKKVRELFSKNLSSVIKELPSVSFEIFQRVKLHLKSYYWVPVERDNPAWTIEDIVSRFQYKLRQRERAQKKRESLERKQKRYEKQLKIPPEMMANFQGLRDLMVAVDAMKKAYAISHCFLSDFLEEMAKRLKIKRDDLYFLTPGEISEILNKQKQISQKQIELRRNCIVIGHRVSGKWQVQIIKGRQAKLIVDKLARPQKIKERDIIKGVSASPGKVMGLVKILKNATEADKLSQDEILVTPMTTPDYISAIHKAAAIVTDEGGVLCHAAIVSREFGIPCIIGTDNATKVLRDGDLVEVNAEKGIVKILEKSK